MKTMNKKRVLGWVGDLVILAVLIGMDQFTKQLAVSHLKDRPGLSIIKGVFELNYLENRGAAFGMLQNQKFFFVIIAVVMLVIITYVIVKMPDHKKYKVLELLLVMISAGAIGNMIDRIKTNYVVDFFYFKLINFPIFNVADIYVSVSCVLLAVLILFYYKEDDFKFLSRKKNAEE